MRLLKKIMLYSALLVLLGGTGLYAGQRRLLGPNMTMSWASSYLTINSGSVTVQNDTTWTYATAGGWFFDYMINPYVSFRTQWFFYPEMINSKPEDMFDDTGRINLHEMGFSLLRHFGKGYVTPWFGAGPYLQFATIDSINSYILHVLLSVGFDYECFDDIYLCPELLCGIGAGLFKSDEKNVVIDVPTGTDFSTSGIIIFFKFGVAKSF